MALDMDPERRRRLMALADWHDEWQGRHGIDDEEFTPEGAGAPDRKVSPSVEQEWEYVRRAREIMGLDPETGHRTTP